MNPFAHEKPLIMGHRGFQTHYPENTLASFMAAVKAGVQYVELDVTLTRDGQVAVIHDDTVDRTTNGIGPVHRYTLDGLRKLDAGGWFHPRFSGEHIPALGEVLEKIAGKARVNIEIKSHMRTTGAPVGEIEGAVVDLVRSKKMELQVLISSFDPAVLKSVRQLSTTIPLAYISKYSRHAETLAQCQALEVYSYHPNLEFLDRRQVNMMRQAGIYVFPYNINDENDICKAFDLGVDGLIAKNPILARMCYSGDRQWVQNA